MVKNIFSLFGSILVLFLCYFFLKIILKDKITNYETKKVKDNYSYIIIGGGSSGCVIASRLSEAGESVLLLEAGEPFMSEDFLDSFYIPAKLHNVFKTSFFWKYNITNTLTDSKILFKIIENQKKFIKERYLQGKTVGGGGSINALIWLRGSKKMYDLWGELTDDKEIWNYKTAKKYFKIAEEKMKVKKKNSYINPIMKYIYEKGSKIIGFSEDFFENNNKGIGYTWVNIDDGKRFGPVEGYLLPEISVNYSRLHLRMNAFAEKIIFKNNKAIGVEFFDEKLNENIEVFAEKEIIVSAGSINSAKLLIQSGLGDEKELEKLQIPVIKNLPGIGKSLKDHPMIMSLNFQIKEDLNLISNLNNGIFQDYFEYLLFEKGRLSSNGVDITFYFQTKYSKIFSDIQIECLTFLGESKNYFSCVLQNYFPKSVGKIELDSRDPYTIPKVNVNLLNNTQDIDAIIEGFKLTKKFVEEIFGKDVKMILPKDNLSDEEIKQFIFKNILSGCHPTSTCKMGKKNDHLAVVDSKFNVFGVEGLRVVGAASFPEIPDANTNAATIMSSEIAAKIILKNSI